MTCDMPEKTRLALRLLSLCLAVILLVPSLAAASSRLAFVRDGDIWTIGNDGKGAMRLTASGIDYGPVWSPDRGTLAFIRSDFLKDIRKVCTVSSAGGPGHAFKYRDPLGATEYRYTSGLAYSPDGKTLAIADGYGIKGNPYTHDCIILAKVRTGTSRLRLKRQPGLDTTWRLSWSPDGLFLAERVPARLRCLGPPRRQGVDLDHGPGRQWKAPPDLRAATGVVLVTAVEQPHAEVTTS